MVEQIRLFYKAADNQTNVMVKNILGQGIDNHLLGLRQLAKNINIDTATDVFQDPSFQIVHHFALSTSQVRIPHYLPLFFQSPPPLINRKKKRGSIFYRFFSHLRRGGTRCGAHIEKEIKMFFLFMCV